MPTINTLVADLSSGAIVGVAAKPASNETTGSGTFSDTHLLKYLYTDVAATITGSNRLPCPKATATSAANGRYLHFEDGQRLIEGLDPRSPRVLAGPAPIASLT